MTRNHHDSLWFPIIPYDFLLIPSHSTTTRTTTTTTTPMGGVCGWIWVGSGVWDAYALRLGAHQNSYYFEGIPLSLYDFLWLSKHWGNFGGSSLVLTTRGFYYHKNSCERRRAQDVRIQRRHYIRSCKCRITRRHDCIDRWMLKMDVRIHV